MNGFPLGRSLAQPGPGACGGLAMAGHPRRRGAWLLGVAALALVVAGGCGHGQRAKAPAKPPEVVATKPIISEVTDYQDFTGRLSAVKTVDIRARVSGYVKSAPFTDGDLVKEGDVLFQIDPGSYLADLNLAKANLKLAEAERNVQEKMTARTQRLSGTKAASQEDLDTALATLEKDRANVEAMEASRDRTKLFVDWTKVVAPVSGRVSRRLVDPGNLVNADNTVLTTLVTENPMYVYFDVDERTFLDLMGSTSAGMSSWITGLRFPVLMRLANEDNFTQAGAVDFIDNQVNPTTGTIRMRGVFQNPRGFLKPGLFARVRLPIGAPYQALLIPDEALQSDQGRKYVYVVKKQKNDKGEEEDRVEYRKVTLGQAVSARKKRVEGEEEPGEYILRVIRPAEKGKEATEGVREGERVIVSGQQRVRPEALVQVKTQPPPESPESPLGKLLAENAPGPRQAQGKHKTANGRHKVEGGGQ